MIRALPVVAAALGLGLAGCVTGPDYVRPEVDMPEEWHSALDAGVVPEDVSTLAWWETLDDPLLTSLIERAETENLDLRIAQARVREARAARTSVAAGRLPAVGASSSYTVERTSEDAVVPGTDRTEDFFFAGFDAAWELDLFGRVARSVEAADAVTAAEVERLRDLFVTLAGEVALNYIEFRTAQARLDVAYRNINSQAETARLTRARYEAGLSSEFDTVRAEAQLETSRSQVPTLQTQRDLALYRLSVLLGAAPSALADELAAPAPLPAPPDAVPVGLPSTLLQRRADIRAAERELAAATARIGAAIAERFPQFTLTGILGAQSVGISGGMLDAANRVWSIGPGVRIPIFEGGRIRANIQIQNARQEQALYAYEQTILLALEEVEGGLVSFSREQQRSAALARALQHNERSVRLARERYNKGLEDFLSVLTAELQAFVSEDQLLESRANVLINLIALYKALGGGWQSAYPEPPNADDDALPETRN